MMETKQFMGVNCNHKLLIVFFFSSFVVVETPELKKCTLIGMSIFIIAMFIYAYIRI